MFAAETYMQVAMFEMRGGRAPRPECHNTGIPGAQLSAAAASVARSIFRRGA